MNDREKLIEMLERTEDTDGCKILGYNQIRRIADHLIAHGVTVQKWIPVNDPPKENGSYLVATERGGVFITHYWTDGQRFSSRGGRTVITHWKERPLPPMSRAFLPLQL